MPMVYAKLLREFGFDVKYIVDVPKENTLSRPECHFEDISYPYPSWIKEIVTLRPSIRALLPRYLLKSILDEVKDFDVYFLCDWYISLAPFLPESSKIIILPHGADLDTWCNLKKANYVSRVGAFSWLWFLKKFVARRVIRNMRRGLFRANAVTYFPKGMNSDGEEVLVELPDTCEMVIRRYDINTALPQSVKRKFRDTTDRLTICSAVRFDFVCVEGGENKYLKGSDVIIKGISKFARSTSIPIKVIFFNKGRDVDGAKRLCHGEGIGNIVEWCDPLPFLDLLQVMNDSDICFDQVGNHWIGAVGAYSLLLGKPLIANYRPEVMDNHFRGFNPICQATTVDDVFNHLVRLSDVNDRKAKYTQGIDFAVENFSSQNTAEMYIKLISAWESRS